MTKRDFEKIDEAILRFEVKKIDGIYDLKNATAEELNISPKLFRYISAAFDYSNIIRNPNKLYKKSSKKIVRFKSGDPESDQGIDTTYCASYSVAALSIWVSVNKAKTYQDSQGWQDGVPLGEMDNFVKHFYKNITISSGVSSLSSAEPGKTIATFVYENTPSGAHASVFHYWNENSDYVNFIDPQNNNRLLLIHKDDIIKVYEK